MEIAEKLDGRLFTLIGPGGAGKNALMEDVLSRLSDLYQLATATTRPKRNGEKDGQHHLFMTEDVFRKMIANDELLEWQEVTPNRFYGIPRASVETNLSHGKYLIADIDVYGAKILRANYPEHVILVFINVPGKNDEERLNILRQRMVNRNEAPDVIEDRLRRAREIELPFAQECDYVIVNEDINVAAEELYSIIQSERTPHQ